VRNEIVAGRAKTTALLCSPGRLHSLAHHSPARRPGAPLRWLIATRGSLSLHSKEKTAHLSPTPGASAAAEARRQPRRPARLSLRGTTVLSLLRRCQTRPHYCNGGPRPDRGRKRWRSPSRPPRRPWILGTGGASSGGWRDLASSGIPWWWGHPPRVIHGGDKGACQGAAHGDVPACPQHPFPPSSDGVHGAWHLAGVGDRSLSGACSSDGSSYLSCPASLLPGSASTS
jgi:hypothetical protein